jgi:hypothetical protein
MSPTRTPPHVTPPAPPSVRLQQVNSQQWHNGTQYPSSIPPPTSHGFQSVSHNAIPPSMMSVHNLRSTAASYQNREYERSQVQQPYIQPDGRRMSSMSSGTSSTQIGSGAGEQAPHLYSPHQGNTLSYASSTAPSVVAPVWDGSSMPRMPNNETVMPTVAPGHVQQMPTHSGPPAYMNDGRG